MPLQPENKDLCAAIIIINNWQKVYDSGFQTGRVQHKQLSVAVISDVDYDVRVRQQQQ